MSEIKYATVFTDGTEITPYLATAYAEGFCEGDGVSREDIFKAWSYLCGTKLGYSLQGFFGRSIEALIDMGYLSNEGEILQDLPE